MTRPTRLDHLVVPRRHGRPNTLNVPRLDIWTVADFLEDGVPTLELQWESSEDGSVVHTATLSPAAGGATLTSEAGTHHIPVVAVRTAGEELVEVALGCPACPAVADLLYLTSAGPRCRRCSGLASGARTLLFKGLYARRMVLQLFESRWPTRTESAARELADSQRAAEATP